MMMEEARWGTRKDCDKCISVWLAWLMCVTSPAALGGISYSTTSNLPRLFVQSPATLTAKTGLDQYQFTN